MSLNSIDSETDINKTVTKDSNSKNVADISKNISKGTNLSTSATVELSDSKSSNLKNDDITVNTKEYETNSRKRKDKSQCGTEEIDSNCLTGINEEVKKNKMEIKNEIPEETKKIFIDCGSTSYYFPGSDQENKDSAQSLELSDSSATIDCKSCQFKAVSNQQLKFHLFNAHLRGKYLVYFKCKICQFKSNDENSMFLHQNEHGIKQEIQDVASDISLNNNVEIDIVSKEVTLNVEDCQEIERLESIKNCGGSIFECFDCNYVVKKRESLQNHVIQHKKSKFTCDEHFSLTSGCPKCIYECCLLLLPYKMLTCSMCDFTTCKSYHYLRHRRKHSTDRSKSKFKISDKTNQNNSPPDELKCYHCLYSTDSKDSLKLHAIAKLHYKQEFNCDLHQQVIDNACSKCIYETILVELGADTIFSCQFCDFKTLMKDQLSQHQNNTNNCKHFQAKNLYGGDNSEDEKL